MRFTLAQLRKLKMPYTYEEEIDLKEDLNGFENIISCDLCKVETTMYERGIDTYLCKFIINSDLTMEDSVSLKPISYHVFSECEEIFSNDEEIEDAIRIDGITLDTKEAIITNILIEKPMSLTLEEFESDVEDEADSEPEEYVNPAFASLKELL